MKIRKSTPADLPEIMKLYETARAFMRQSGNPNQWKNNHPPEEQIKQDIQDGTSYVCEHESGEILATFFLTTASDPTYTKIDGAWLNNAPYGTVHRIARNHNTPNAKGAGAYCLNWCYEQIGNIRIDTHEDNTPMIGLLERIGFKRCGIIWLENGEERIAFQRI